jgi:Ca2+-transporting ATPase
MINLDSGTVLESAHALDPASVAEALRVETGVGLDAVEARRRAIADGPNELETSKRVPVWRMLLESATEPFVVLLAIAGGLAIVVGEVRDGLLVLLGLLPIIGADVITEYRGERALEALREASAPIARVRRGGAALTVAASELVVGDVALFQAGDVVPADARIIRSDHLLFDRSVLTGESMPEEGRVAPDSPEAPLPDRRAMAYSGTSVVGGRGEGLVTAIGQATVVGQIAGGLKSRERRRSPLQRELDRLVRILLVVAIALIAFTTGSGFVRGHSLGENIVAGISAAIAAIPEEPPVLLAVVLGLGAYRLLKRGVLVRRLNAEETLGAVDLIVTDKTGTLTQNRLAISSVRTLEGPLDDGPARLRLLEDAFRAEEDAWPGEGHHPGSFTRALGNEVARLGGQTILDPGSLVEAVPATDGAPMTTTHARRGGVVEGLMLGAPEVVLGVVDDALPDADTHARWADLIEAVTAGGERSVALARRVDDGPWEIRALIGFADPIRPGIATAVSTAREAGIQVVVVTGDHPRTAGAIAREATLETDSILTGETIASWDPEKLGASLDTLQVVARSTPAQKLQLVQAARLRGRIVAVTGDGVNDAPALHGADVAVAMGSGTAVAREASDLVLGDDSFATLMFALAEGRRIVDNVQKGLVFLISTHVAFLGFILLSTIFVAERQVLIPVQILWMEFFIDLSTSVAFEREPPEPNLMTRPPRHAEQPLLTNGVLAKVVAGGSFTAIGALGLMSQDAGSFEHAAWLAYTALVVGQCVRAYSNRSVREPIHHLGRNGFLLGACVVAVAIQVLIPYLPPLAEAFRATPLGLTDWLLVAGIALAPALVAEVVRLRGRGRTIWVA